MNKLVKKIAYLVGIMALIVLSNACKKKVKHKWIEVGAPTFSEIVEPGVHPERGKEADAIPVETISVYVPKGMDKEGIPQYKKVMYEVDAITTDAVDQALKSCYIVGDDAVFCDLELSESDEVLSAGPGAADSKLTKKGLIVYAGLNSPLDNSDEYEGKYYKKDLKGMISVEDIVYCISETFRESFQLVSCEVKNIDFKEAKEKYGK